MIHHILNLPVAATLTYEICNSQREKGRFVVRAAQGEIPKSGAVYFLVDNEGRLQKIGMTDNALGLEGRMQDYEATSGGNDDTLNLYYRMMTGPLQGRSLSVHYQSFEITEVADVLGQQVEIRYTAHRFIESHLGNRARELRLEGVKTYPLWLERGMYPNSHVFHRKRP